MRIDREHHGFAVAEVVPMTDDWSMVTMKRPVAATSGCSVTRKAISAVEKGTHSPSLETAFQKPRLQHLPGEGIR